MARPWGDGHSMVADGGYYTERLLRGSFSPVSIDGIKATMLANWFETDDATPFNIMGHPKALTPTSIKHISSFMLERPDVQPVTFMDYEHLRP